MNNPDDLRQRIEAAARDPQNLGELAGADAVGTAGSAACGDMIRLWIKFKQQSGKQVIDKATFQAFGCETAIAVASLATELIRGKTADEVLAMTPGQLAPSLGPLPPVRIHCAHLVETALHSALGGQPAANPERSAAPSAAPAPAPAPAPSLVDKFTQPVHQTGKPKIIFRAPE
jgi:NifU-like protein involved in Fe-S cluster formation